MTGVQQLIYRECHVTTYNVSPSTFLQCVTSHRSINYAIIIAISQYARTRKSMPTNGLFPYDLIPLSMNERLL